MQNLIAPIITEKSMQMAGRGWYTFQVENKARKEQIIREINNQFKVHVVEIRTIKTKSGAIRTGRKKLLVSPKNFKKALVKLKDKEKITLFEVEQAPTK